MNSIYSICYTIDMAKLTRQRINALYREREKLIQELSSFSLLIRGSFFQRFSICSRPNCNCHKGKRHGPRSYVAVTQGKTQKQHYIPKQQVHAVRKGIQQQHRLQEIVARITEINLKLMKGGQLDEHDA